MSLNSTSRRRDLVDPFLVALLVAVVFVAVPWWLFGADAATDEAAVDGREQAIAALVERYDVETIEVHYEVTNDEHLVQIDRAGNLDDSAIRAQAVPVVTIDGVRRPDCRIAEETTEAPRLDCADGEPAERDGSDS